MNRSPKFVRRISCICAGTMAAAVAWAEPQEIAASLTLDQVVREALRANAQLHSMRAKWEAMQERPAQAQTLPNPMFKYSGMDQTSGGTWPNTNEKRFMVEQEFPWPGKRALRSQVAGKDAEAMQRESESMQREIVMLVKDNYYDLYGVQRALTITRGEADVLARMELIAESRFATGQVSQQDVLKAQTEITMLKQKLLELAQQEATAKAKLNQLLNQSADAPLGLAVTAPPLALDSGVAQLANLAQSHRAEIKTAQVQVERSQAEREQMRKEVYPDYRLGLEYRSFDNSPDMLMFTISFDLPIWRAKYRAGVREADKMVESRQAALLAERRQTAFDVQDAAFKLRTAQQTLVLYQTALIPQAQARFQSSEAGYRTGKVGFLDLLESERFLLNARVMAAMAEGSLGQQQARLERAVGVDLPSAGNNGGGTQ